MTQQFLPADDDPTWLTASRPAGGREHACRAGETTARCGAPVRSPRAPLALPFAPGPSRCVGCVRLLAVDARRVTCRHCRAELRERPGSSGRYRWTRADAPDTDTLGAGCECPANERGHEPGRNPPETLDNPSSPGKVET